IGGFFAFGRDFRGGVSVAAGDLDGDGRDEIVVSSGSDGRREIPTTVRVYRSDGRLISQFNPFGVGHFSNLTVRVEDIDDDGWGEIVALGNDGSGQGTVSVFDIQGEGTAETVLKADGVFSPPDGRSLNRRFVAGLPSGNLPLVTVFHPGQVSPRMFYGFEPDFRGGIQALAMD
ncbi:FG-GAP repeat protein, partial [Candidatus Uhrbacteria bacterium]|nr:FG-GAP repeat protein [Candidatus Uhrbacteria bacterium]